MSKDKIEAKYYNPESGSLGSFWEWLDQSGRGGSFTIEFIRMLNRRPRPKIKRQV